MAMIRARVKIGAKPSLLNPMSDVNIPLALAFFFIFLLLSSGVGQTYWTTTIFITSDNIINDNGDDKMLNSIKNYLEELSNR